MTIRGPLKETLQAGNPPGLALLGCFGLLGILIVLAILLGGCETGPAMFLASRDREIGESTQAVQLARNDVERAKAYSTRNPARTGG